MKDMYLHEPMRMAENNEKAKGASLNRGGDKERMCLRRNA